MAKRCTSSQIVSKLRQSDVLIGQGKNIPDICRELEISQQTYYRWRQKYGGMSPDMVKEYRQLRQENQRLRKIVADQMIDNGYIESFNSRLRDELLNGEIFLHIDELKYVVERWRMDYNHYRPHSSLSYMTPAEFAKLCVEVGCCKRQRVVMEDVEISETLS